MKQEEHFFNNDEIPVGRTIDTDIDFVPASPRMICENRFPLPAKTICNTIEELPEIRFFKKNINLPLTLKYTGVYT